MVISSDFRVGQHRDDDHEEDAPYFSFYESPTLGLSPNSEIIENFRKFDVFDLFLGYNTRLRTQNSSVGVIFGAQ